MFKTLTEHVRKLVSCSCISYQRLLGLREKQIKSGFMSGYRVLVYYRQVIHLQRTAINTRTKLQRRPYYILHPKAPVKPVIF
jgi:hypothetical protein